MPPKLSRRILENRLLEYYYCFKRLDPLGSYYFAGVFLENSAVKAEKTICGILLCSKIEVFHSNFCRLKLDTMRCRVVDDKSV